jgi:hypothetical protein
VVARDWSEEPQAQIPVYANRRRLRGARGRRLMRQRGERIERSFAHLYDTGEMRRTHLRGHTNILKRPPADSCGRLQSWARHAPPDRQRHAARAAGSPRDRYRYAFLAHGRYPPLARHNFRMAANHGRCAPSYITVPDVLNPIIVTENPQSLGYRLVDTASTNFNRMFNFLKIDTGNFARLQRHNDDLSYSLFIRYVAWQHRVGSHTLRH